MDTKYRSVDGILLYLRQAVKCVGLASASSYPEKAGFYREHAIQCRSDEELILLCQNHLDEMQRFYENLGAKVEHRLSRDDSLFLGLGKLTISTTAQKDPGSGTITTCIFISKVDKDRFLVWL